MKLIPLLLVLSVGVNVLGLASARKPRQAPVHLVKLPRVAPPQVMLAWNPVDDPNLAGYWLYLGPATHFYTNLIAVGNVTNVSLTNLSLGIYYFAVTARNLIGAESAFSNEAVWTNLLAPPVTNFLLSVSIEQSSDFTNWTTFTNLGQFQATNSGAPIYWRSLINVQPQ